jgi:replicative DNA helicase Mcm
MTEGSKTFIGRARDIINARYLDQLKELAANYPHQKSFHIDYHDIEELDYEWADILSEKPYDVFKSFRLALSQLDTSVSGEANRYSDITIRIDNYDNIVLSNLKELKSQYVGKLVKFDGLVKRNSKVIPRVYKTVFECAGCMRIHTLYQVDRDEFIEPKQCTDCGSKKFYLVKDDTRYMDMQRARVQEPLEDVQGRSIPRDMELILENDIVDSILPGEQIRVTGILIAKEKGKNNYDWYVEVNNIETLRKEYDDIELTDEDIDEVDQLSRDPHIFDKLSNSLVPSIKGYKYVKDVLVLQLFGGTEKLLEDGSRKRPEIHVLIVSDPSMGKTVMLENIILRVPSGVYTSGKGTSAAGLTAAAMPDENGNWALEAGALVLGDKGHVCIDEFDKMRAEDRSALHDALESGKIYINKAGINATLNARCSVTAAANPKYSKFDKYKPIVEQVNLPDSILSRFDVIFLITDTPNKDGDREKGRLVLGVHRTSELDFDIENDMFRKYVAYARQNIHPLITEEAEELLLDYYVKMRGMVVDADEDPTPITLRQLEGMVRLTEASAKAHLRKRAGIEDAERAISIMQDYLNRVGFDPETGQIDIQRVQGGMPKSWENKVEKTRKLLASLEEEYDTPIKKLSRHVIIDEVLDKVTSRKEDAEKLVKEAL